MKTRQLPPLSDFNTELQLKGFKAYELVPHSNAARVYSRRDYYKVCLATGESMIHYADRGIEVNGTTLFFGNPHIPYSWEYRSDNPSGFACLFTEQFFKGQDRMAGLQESPLFKIGGTPIFKLNEEQRAFISSLYLKMIEEQDADYVFKNDVIRNYLSLIMHEAQKMQPEQNFFQHKNASSRIASLFLELLERQFPVESSGQPLSIRTAQDFASHLSVHVNHLNRSVKEVTGKATSIHISDRITTEARALLQHTDWSVAEIAYALGFDYPTYFNNFFKKQTGVTPTAIRAQVV